MKIKYMKGDMFKHVFPKGQNKVFLHGCNAQGVMGSGVAAQIKKLYPEAYEAYRLKHSLEGLILGDVVFSHDYTTNTSVMNAITQQYYGRDKKTVYVDYKVIEECIKLVDEECRISQWLYEDTIEVVMPKIGCGLANGDWNVVSAIIEEHSNNFIPVVYEL